MGGNDRKNDGEIGWVVLGGVFPVIFVRTAFETWGRGVVTNPLTPQGGPLLGGKKIFWSLTPKIAETFSGGGYPRNIGRILAEIACFGGEGGLENTTRK